MSKLEHYVSKITAGIQIYANELSNLSQRQSEGDFVQHGKMVLNSMLQCLELLRRGKWQDFAQSLERLIQQRIDANYIQPPVSREITDNFVKVRMLHDIGRL